MIGSGWQIYNASPLFDFTFAKSITLGGWLGGAIQWHFAAMWLLAAALVQLTPAVFVASLCLSVACSLFSLLAGFMLPQPAMPPWWRWAFFANPVSYAMAAVAGSQYGDRSDVVVADAPAGSPRELGALLSASYGFGGGGVFPSQWEAVAVLGAFCAVFAAGAYAGLRMNWQKR